jgi:hypothetical protein
MNIYGSFGMRIKWNFMMLFLRTKSLIKIFFYFLLLGSEKIFKLPKNYLQSAKVVKFLIKNKKKTWDNENNFFRRLCCVNRGNVTRGKMWRSFVSIKAQIYIFSVNFCRFPINTHSLQFIFSPIKISIFHLFSRLREL